MDSASSFGSSINGAIQSGNMSHRLRQQQQHHLQQQLHPSSAATAPIQTTVLDFQPPYFPPPYAPVPQTPSAAAAAIPSGIADFQRQFSVATSGGTDPYSYPNGACGGQTSQHAYFASGRQSLLQAVASSNNFDFDGFHRGFGGGGGGCVSSGSCLVYDAPVEAVSSTSSGGARCGSIKTNGEGEYQYSMSTLGGRSTNDPMTYGGGQVDGLVRSCVSDSISLQQALHGASLQEIQLNDDLAVQVHTHTHDHRLTNKHGSIEYESYKLNMYS